MNVESGSIFIYRLPSIESKHVLPKYDKGTQIHRKQHELDRLLKDVGIPVENILYIVETKTVERAP